MRLDMFLKQSRIIKRRSLAKEYCDEGRVSVDGARAKASREVKPGERITVELSRRLLEVEVVEVPAGNVPKERAVELYRVVAEKVLEREEF